MQFMMWLAGTPAVGAQPMSKSGVLIVEVLAPAVVAGWIYLIASTVFYQRRAREYARIARLERTRNAWARARLELFNLVRTGKLGSGSETFSSFYALQTM